MHSSIRSNIFIIISLHNDAIGLIYTSHKHENPFRRKLSAHIMYEHDADPWFLYTLSVSLALLNKLLKKLGLVKGG